MTSRVGTCSSCEARFKVPDTVTATRARCKKCGGIVEIPPAAPSAAEAEAPIAAGAPSAAPPEQPAPETEPEDRPRRAPARRAGGRSARERRSSSRGSRPGRKGAASNAARKARKGREGREGREDHPADRNPLLLWGGIGGGALVLVLGAWWFWDGDDETTPSDPGAGKAVPATAQEEVGPAPNRDVQPDKPAEPALQPIEEDPVPETRTAPDAEPGSGPDTTALADLEPLDSTSPDEWTRLTSDSTTALTNRGVAGSRALNRLVGTGRAAYPALVNALKSLDLSDARAMSDAYPIVKALEELTGKSMTWKSAGDPDQVRYNRKAVALWHETWSKISGSERAWANFTKRVVTAEEAAGLDDEVDPEELLDDF